MIAVITLATASRLPHLTRQREALRRWAPEAEHLVVLMDDTQLDEAWTLHVPGGERLPLAQARNAGARAAIKRGAEVLIFLDVDCIPGASLVSRYVQAVAAFDSLTCGMVTYLEPAPASGYDLDRLVAAPHPARPAVQPGEFKPAKHDEYRLFWSLSFAVSAAMWQQIGGFCEDYSGYGGEDTDFGFTARARGVPMVWIGGADAFHQHHAVSDPPWEHLDDIVRNAQVFRRRWGCWPMEGWLREFADAGAIRWTDDTIERVTGR